MDSYINPKEFISELEQQKANKLKNQDNFPCQPETDVLKFLNGPCSSKFLAKEFWEWSATKCTILLHRHKLK